MNHLTLSPATRLDVLACELEQQSVLSSGHWHIAATGAVKSDVAAQMRCAAIHAEIEQRHAMMRRVFGDQWPLTGKSK